jgi:hypothetical protein
MRDALRTKAFRIRIASVMFFLGICAVAVTQTVTQASTSSPSAREAMINVLASREPHPSLGEEAQTFDRFVGTWDAEFISYRDGGKVYQRKGELHFGWVLDGRAVQDLWIAYPTADHKEREIGTTIRFFDTSLKQWRIVFILPEYNYMVTAQGGREGDRIVLRGVDSNGLPIRWTFSEITHDTFHWQGQRSHDDGKTWKLEEDHHMKRRAS